MTLELVDTVAAGFRPIHLVAREGLAATDISVAHKSWAESNGFNGEAGRLVVLPGPDGTIEGALFGVGNPEDRASLALAGLARLLPEGQWRLASDLDDPTLAAIGLHLGDYRFSRYRPADGRQVHIALPEGADGAAVARIASAVTLVRDLINTPTNEMNAADLEAAVRKLAKTHKARVAVTTGDELLSANFPLIHAVGRASDVAPRLIDMRWGRKDAPKITLVGKGVCFDTGGLDIKPSSNMLLMKKDMGGAANVLGLASMLMAAKTDVALRVLIPAVENAVAGNAFRPGDVLRARNGTTVEIGNTDAEGRLVLADAMALAGEEAPELLIDMATLTGAARTALGPDVPPFYSNDEALAAELASASIQTEDPMWRLPLWRPYRARLASKIADTNNVTTDGFAGSITAALFLERFVGKARAWAHFDIYGWNPVEKPWAPVGGEAQCIRALAQVISRRYP